MILHKLVYPEGADIVEQTPNFFLIGPRAQGIAECPAFIFFLFKDNRLAVIGYPYLLGRHRIRLEKGMVSVKVDVLKILSAVAAEKR